MQIMLIILGAVHALSTDGRHARMPSPAALCAFQGRTRGLLTSISDCCWTTRVYETLVVQGPFSAEHMKLLQESGAVQEDTLVLAAGKGPSLLKDVLQMYEQHGATLRPGLSKLATCQSISMRRPLRFAWSHNAGHT